MRFDCIHCRKATTKPQSVKGAFLRMLTMKEDLLSSENYLRLANNDTEDLSIKKLTRGNPTMKQKFEEARTMAKENISGDGNN